MDPLVVWGSTTPTLVAVVLLLAIAFLAGSVGSLLGLGGGTFIVPALVLLFGFDIHLAVAASLVSVVANSSGAAASYVEDGTTDLRIGMFLETGAAAGGLAGALVAVTILAARSELIVAAFVPIVVLGAVLMLRKRLRDAGEPERPDRLARRLRLEGSYYDARAHRTVEYRAYRTGVGLGLSGLAGFASGLLGIGGGVFTVPALNAFMNVPIRVATSTSMLMLGLTASAGAIIYLLAGDVVLPLAATVVLGMLVGSFVGTRLKPITPPPKLKLAFAAVLFGAAALMALRAAGVLS
ncbi:MAG TPA: sulfite exporter TauE/SafE family protein [Thermoplasmata archaeon]|nr:sulfite exporter TauE/SafE family protein [Thermoplasmata archaeon]